MAGEDAGAKAAGHATKGLGTTLGKKVGPLPLGVWLAGGIGIYLWMRKQQASAGTGTDTQGPALAQQQLANAGGASGYGTDPAGNTGYIDPQTGYVYGSAEDIAALQSQSGLLSGSGSGSGSGGSDTGGTGTTGATPGNVNPGGPPTGTTGATPGNVNPGGPARASTGWRYPAPGGLAANSVSRTGFRLSWHPVTGPGGQHPATYTVAVYQANGVRVSQHAVNTTSSIEYGPGGSGLKPGTSYKVQVWANGGPLAPPGANIVVTTLK